MKTKGEEGKGKGKKWHIMMVKYLTGDNDVANANKRERAKNVRSKKRSYLFGQVGGLFSMIVFSPFFYFIIMVC